MKQKLGFQEPVCRNRGAGTDLVGLRGLQEGSGLGGAELQPGTDGGLGWGGV